MDNQASSWPEEQRKSNIILPNFPELKQR